MIRLMDPLRRLALHRRRFEHLPTIQAPADPLTEDDREFARDMAYLRDLETAVMAEARREAPRMGADEIRAELRLLESRENVAECLYGEVAQDEITDALDDEMARFAALLTGVDEAVA